ncbi:transposase [Acetoanaerobium pronyense]|uniref:Transposase n=1 Tax=Acetoanaerobium pronyense TaxID=1482736 RepID=A0ABS4KKA4_9FIRM|nr:DUF6017 domain-containing protein [Acetoanaerobium pronyense]MBP2028212.1 transposase [Acetoanaerobium pronyense]
MYNQKKFSVNDIYNNSFHQLPSFFFLEDFPKISDKAIILYSLLKSRHELSMKNRWFDKEGNVYLIMKREEMEKTLRTSDKTITKAINELKEYNLLIEVRQGKGRPNLIYITYPDIEKIIKENQDEDILDFKELQEIGESAENLDITLNRNSSDSLDDNQLNRNNSDSRTGNITTLNKYIDNDIDKLYINHSFYNKNKDYKEIEKMNEGMKENEISNDKKILDKEYKNYEKIIKENIEYDLLVSKNDADLVEEITQIIIDTVSSAKEKFRVNGSYTSNRIIKSRFLKLNHMHIEFVIDCLSKNTTQIKDIRSYIITALYNAPSTMNLYYTSKVNHELFSSE